MNKATVITIDGPAGAGKSSVARLVASTLGYSLLDTGAMYRSLALKLGPGAEKLSEDELWQKCAACSFELTGTGEDTTLLCNGKIVGEEIRNEQAANMASSLASVPLVRKYLQKIQRDIGEINSLVAEGRDMGLTVFPQAKFKFFLEASPEVRAKRRFTELQTKGYQTTLAELTTQIIKRDEQDRTRKIDPLHPAADAIIIDTSLLNLNEVVRRILDIITEKSRA